MVNLGLLGVFKYYNFFVDSLAAALRPLWGARIDVLHLDIILPVGISFYTFQTLSYTADIYRGVAPFILIQLLMLGMLAYWPQLATWLPDQVYGS